MTNGEREKLEALKEELAARVVRDPDCKRCETMAYCDVDFIVGPPPGWENMGDRAGMVKPCATCKERRPYTWVRDVPTQALADFIDQQGDYAWPIVALKPLARRGFEFL